MPAARYWRMGVGASTGNTYVSLSEVEFLDASMTDLSVGGTAFASSAYSAGWGADKAFDKNVATSWATVAYDFPCYIGYDHGAPVDVVYVRIRGYSASEYPNSPSRLSLQHSDDGTTWSSPLKLRIDGGEFTSNTYATLAIWDGTFNPIAVGVDLFASTPTLSQTLTTVFLLDATSPYIDRDFGGFGRIAGTVKEDGTPDVPVKRRVRLHREQDGLLIREVWSHPTTGAYSFDHIDTTKRYTVITYDYEHDYRAVIADNITPEAML